MRKIKKQESLPETLRYRDIIVLDSTKETPSFLKDFDK